MTSHALNSFWKCCKRLPEHVQKLPDKNFALFRDNPRHPSLGFAKKGEIYTVEIGRSYRALARERNGHYYWFWIGTHEAFKPIGVNHPYSRHLLKCYRYGNMGLDEDDYRITGSTLSPRQEYGGAGRSDAQTIADRGVGVAA